MKVNRREMLIAMALVPFSNLKEADRRPAHHILPAIPTKSVVRLTSEAGKTGHEATDQTTEDQPAA